MNDAQRRMLVAIYRHLLELPNSDIPLDDTTVVVINELRRDGYVGYAGTSPTVGLTRRGALVAAELNKERTRKRQAEEEARRQRNRDERRRTTWNVVERATV